MNNIDRRDFIKSSAGAVAGITVGMNSISYSGSPSDTIRIAVVGVRQRGADHLKDYFKQPNVEIVAICDIDDAERDKGIGVVEKATGKKPAGFSDIRKLLDNKSIDVVSVATPNHWHALMGIWACQAGKDVYLEKPCSHSYWEGQQLVAAARKYNRIVQHGTQSRSSAALREAVQKIKEGVIGDVYMARALCYKWRDTIGKKADAPVPQGVDYDLWLGPAKNTPFNSNRFHYQWHWNWEYGNGDIGNQGVHEMDIARWGLGVTLPNKVSSMGGHFMFDDDQQTPNTMISTLEFDKNGKKVLLSMEVRHWMTNNESFIGKVVEDAKFANPSNCIGNIFYGSEGYLAIDGYSEYKTFLGKKGEPGPGRKEGGNHYANFLEAVRSRKVDTLNADIEEGHYSSALVHLANISYRTGSSFDFDPVKQSVINDPKATALMRRQTYRAPYVITDKV